MVRSSRIGSTAAGSREKKTIKITSEYFPTGRCVSLRIDGGTCAGEVAMRGGIANMRINEANVPVKARTSDASSCPEKYVRDNGIRNC